MAAYEWLEFVVVGGDVRLDVFLEGRRRAVDRDHRLVDHRGLGGPLDVRAAEDPEREVPHILLVDDGVGLATRRLVIVSREAPGVWASPPVDSAALIDGPACGDPLDPTDVCQFDFIELFPGVLVTSGGGDVRALWTRVEVSFELVSVSARGIAAAVAGTGEIHLAVYDVEYVARDNPYEAIHAPPTRLRYLRLGP